MKVVFDVDSVLADIMTPWMEIYNERYEDDVSISDITSWEVADFVKPEAKKDIFSIVTSEGFYEKVKPIQRYVALAKEFVEQGHEVSICTSCANNPMMIKEKLAWLEEHIPFIDSDNIMIVTNKGLACGDMLVDDRPKNLKDFMLSNPLAKGVLVQQPHNHLSRFDILNDSRFLDRIEII